MSSYDDVNQVFQKKLQEDPEFRKKYEEGISASLEKAGLIDAPIEIALERGGKGVETSVRGAKQAITAKAFWWGYRFVIPETAMKDFKTAGNIVASFMTFGGTAIAASGGTLGPLVSLVAAYAYAEFALMKAIDRGNGVYLSASWAAAAVIIPTPIK